MQINLIWAQAKGRVIGKDGKMPWHLPEDLAHFKRTTLGHPVIMGRKTWDSLPAKFRPLPGRMNVVISSDVATRENLKKNGTSPAQNLREALLICEQLGSSEVWVIGGAQIYAQALPLAQKLVITEIDAEFEGDAFAPAVDASWRETERDQLTATNGLKLDFVTYQRA
ncbi:dihydrofolate reductase [Variovorax sp. PCZ-1]|uniref:dihydrofolate reductase n=1 Tax=Variovorax sp. PCZ-1 TaxID=2835533 RepID=UPI001BCFAD1F|nr:dihydrofolate reductase [Variovorax sp. PCZ-1]MBS7806985.1 dihydrofolate reductase [Variovorax sp. PCZ-1]